MTNPNDDFLRELQLAELLDDEDAIELPEDGPTELVSDATKEKAKKAGRFAVLGGKWAAGKAKDLAQLLCYQAQLMAQLPLDDPYAYTELVCKLVR